MMLCKTLKKEDLATFIKMSGNQFIADTKEDGDRIRCVVTNCCTKLYNRRGVEVTNTYPELQTLKGNFVIDGEMCVLDDRGVSQFNEGITHRSHCKSPESVKSHMGDYPITYVVFDCLSVDGEDVTMKPWVERRKLLEELNITHSNIKLSEYSEDLIDMWNKITALGGEGIILKRKDSVYEKDKRSNSWLKCKDTKEVDLTFSKFEDHNMGITIENTQGIRCVVNGAQAAEVKQRLLDTGKVHVTIRHLGQTATGKFRQPVFTKIVED